MNKLEFSLMDQFLWEVCACVPAGCGSVLEMALCPVCVFISLVLAVYRLRAGLDCLGRLYGRPKIIFFFPVHFKKGFETLLFIKRYCKLSVGQLKKQQDYKVA